MAFLGLALCGRQVRQFSAAKWLMNARKASAIFPGARNLSYVPVDDVIAGLTDDQSEVFINYLCSYEIRCPWQCIELAKI